MGLEFNTRGVGMIVLALFLLVVIGMGYNNATASGFSNTALVNSCTSLNCPMYGNQNPCSANSHYCYANNTISILNPNSPVTYLISGDILGFIGSFSAAPQGSSTFQYVSACIAETGSGANVVSFYCNTNSTVHWGGTGTLDTPFNATSNAGNESDWSIRGYLPSNPSQVGYLTIYGVYWKNGTSLTFKNGQGSVVGSVTCPNALTHSVSYCLAQAWQGTSATLGNTLALFGFLAGIILLILSLGIGGSAEILTAGFSWSENAQGTRLIQTAGITLLAFIPLYSEFGTWITDTNLGFTGGGVLMTFLILGLLFFGIFEQTTSGTAGS